MNAISIPRKKNHRGRLASGDPNPVDIHIGKRLRLRRMLIGMSQEDVAQAVGVAFQQIQKYECAVNRISTARLWAMAQVLQCPVSFFYDGMEEAEGPRRIAQDMPPALDPSTDLSSRNETLKLVRAYSTIRQPGMRRQILELANSLSRCAPEAAAP